MSLDTEKLAELLDGVAAYVDAIESERSEKIAADRNTRIEKIAKDYENATGEALPESVRNKLANVEADALEHLLKIANNSDGSPESLGTSAEIDDDALPTTNKEAAAHAESRFLNWIIS